MACQMAYVSDRVTHRLQIRRSHRAMQRIAAQRRLLRYAGEPTYATVADADSLHPGNKCANNDPTLQNNGVGYAVPGLRSSSTPHPTECWAH